MFVISSIGGPGGAVQTSNSQIYVSLFRYMSLFSDICLSSQIYVSLLRYMSLFSDLRPIINVSLVRLIKLPCDN